mmetsp:Transcript_23560/g.58526  ORF Transcript_23560/g.58526 Transcript_23560/m.58526 type:complete len:205 (-) Transcript_23560:320-934(-)
MQHVRAIRLKPQRLLIQPLPLRHVPPPVLQRRQRVHRMDKPVRVVHAGSAAAATERDALPEELLGADDFTELRFEVGPRLVERERVGGGHGGGGLGKDFPCAGVVAVVDLDVGHAEPHAFLVGVQRQPFSEDLLGDVVVSQTLLKLGPRLPHHGKLGVELESRGKQLAGELDVPGLCLAARPRVPDRDPVGGARDGLAEEAAGD